MTSDMFMVESPLRSNKSKSKFILCSMSWAFYSKLSSLDSPKVQSIIHVTNKSSTLQVLFRFPNSAWYSFRPKILKSSNKKSSCPSGRLNSSLNVQQIQISIKQMSTSVLALQGFFWTANRSGKVSEYTQ